MHGFTTLSLKRLTAGLALGTCIGIATTAPAQAASSGQISLSSLAFAQSSVDASAGGSSITLNWSITDTDTAATFISGDVYVSRVAADGSPVGPTYDIGYALNGGRAVNGVAATADSGSTAQSSTYSYAFPIAQYAASTSATWAVLKVTATDDQAATTKLGGNALAKFGAMFTATESLDAVGMSYDQLGLNGDEPGYYDDANGSVTVSYGLEVMDQDSGFWRGTMVLEGPGGQTISSRFANTNANNGWSGCGTDPEFWGWDPADELCTVQVTFPQGTAAGTWVVSKLKLTDAAGGETTYSKIDAAPVQLTQDAVLSADGFSLSPDTFNNWAGTAYIGVNFTPHGAVGGIASVAVTTGNGCSGSTTNSPGVAADGSITVQASVPPIYTTTCTITGISITDGAGDLAVYGTIFSGPSLNLTATQVPDTTSPTATAATLGQTTVSSSNPPNGVALTVQVSSFAAVDEISAGIYNSNGAPVGGGYGGVTWTTDGSVEFTIPYPYNSNLPPGTYTVGFTLTDTAGHSTAYGYPGGTPAPSGPLNITVTS